MSSSLAPYASPISADANSSTRPTARRSARRERVPAWARIASALMVLALRLGMGLGLAARATERAFARLGFCDVMVSPGLRRAFVSNLLVSVRAKLRSGDLRSGPVRRWVARLLASAASTPRISRRFARRHGFEPPAFLVVAATERCNLECAHCYQGSTARAATSIEYTTLSALVGREREEWGASLLVVTGGEPLLYSSGGGDLFMLARQHESTLFIVYTNGTRISDAVARELAELGNVVPLISLEGDEEETRRLRGPRAWRAAMDAMRHLRAHGALFGVSLTAGRTNAELLGSPGYYQALRDRHGATFFWVLERAPIGRAAADSDLLSLDEKACLQAALSEAVRRHGLLVTSFLHAPGAQSGCFGAGRVDRFYFVDARADIKHCVYSPFVLGNAGELLGRGAPLSSFLFEGKAAWIRDAQRAFFAASGAIGEGQPHRPCPVLARSAHSLPLVS